MIDELRVAAGGVTSRVLIGPGLVEDAGRHVGRLVRGSRLALVSDEAVWAAQGDRLRRGLHGIGLEPVPILIPPGEASKSWPMLESLLERLLALGIERGDHFVAFGGGVVGDLAGLAASLLKRGCGIVHVPTSLLAQVDSSIGGKTAINARAGKNLVGTFHFPSLVLIDPDCLSTLPFREYRAGIAEIVKYGLIDDLPFFEWCEANMAQLAARDREALRHAITTSVRAKARIVAEDARETGERALLNLGHSFAHAIEAEAGYAPTILHGEAVGIGMAMAFRLSARLGLCDRGAAERVEACLESAGLPTRLADAKVPLRAQALLDRMRHDKKARGGAAALILATAIGRAFIEPNAPVGELRAFLAEETAVGAEAD